tara:strand:- start:238 stop:474 length:237 start_codon:yes stop_codon:yes gene_type:complete
MTSDDKVEEIRIIWDTLLTPVKAELLGRLDADSLEGALDNLLWSTDDLLEEFRRCQRDSYESQITNLKAEIARLKGEQ